MFHRSLLFTLVILVGNPVEMILVFFSPSFPGSVSSCKAVFEAWRQFWGDSKPRPAEWC